MTPSELIETLKIFHVHGPQIGTRICSLSCSGGEAGLVADLAAPHGIDFPPVPQATHDRLFAVLGEIPTISNPLDYHTFIWGDGPKTTEVFSAMLEPMTRALHHRHPTHGPLRPLQLSARAGCDRRSAEGHRQDRPACCLDGRELRRTPRPGDDGSGVCTLLGLETALAAVKAAQTPRVRRAGARPGAAPARQPVAERGRGQGVSGRGRGAGAAFGDRARLADLDVAGLTPPLALKGLGFAHKTEAGAVRLGLASLAGQAEMPGATGYLAEEMVTGAVAEVLLGLRRDPVYGATLTLGLGGVTAEVLADTVTLVLPATEEDILAAARRLRLWPLLDGYRGRPRADMAAVASIAARLGR